MNGSKTVAAVILTLLLIIFLASPLLKASLAAPEEAPQPSNPSEVLWSQRDYETILQGLLILGGVFAILMLLRASRREVRE